ncbi:NAD(P)/FAD-dependent oxidoreductase [Nitrincola tapanii]|uniref:NAD(P)/FAD-dependent oxidoreductase n=1 Tax=Nitrincola tapanii TaxID=1708751 RepID=A0A5A9W6N4_9GAMM|nr:FAD-dependent oxidoreductase [Nitrincola tapanii]KAA0876376.1 NAD(P)/FAD-dependent oxidoreductase [Nitrincola tapanii]
MMYDLIILGNGMAAHRLVQELVAQPQRPQRILMLGEEPCLPYNRVLLSSMLANEVEDAAAELASAQWYQEQGIELLTAVKVSQLQPQQKCVSAEDGRQWFYRRLVLATGSSPVLPGCVGENLKGVLCFRTQADLHSLRQAAQEGQAAVVIGGGFLGLEAAEGLRHLGMEVTLLQRGDRLLNRQLDKSAAQLLQSNLSARGLNILTHSSVAEICADAQGQVRGVQLKSGDFLPAQTVVCALGIQPRIDLAKAAGLQVARGIQVNTRMQSSDTDIFALGECCQLGEQTYGLVAPIWEQAKVLAAILAGQAVHYQEPLQATQLKISGIALFSCGEISAEPSPEDVVLLDAQAGVYARLLRQEGRLQGAILYGDTQSSPDLVRLIRAQEVIKDPLALLSGQTEISELRPEEAAA